jgi:AcrR family transcriptional regulator
MSMAGLAATRSEATRARLRDAALALFAEKGVDQTTTRDIAEAAGIAEGTIYRHFRSKEELIWDIFFTNYRNLALRLEEIRSANAGLERRLGAMVACFCELFDGNPELFRFLFFVQHGQLAKLEPRAPTPVKVVERTVREAMAAGEIPEGEVALAAAMVFGIVMQPAVFKIYGRIDSPMQGLSARLAEACGRALGAPQDAP